MRKFAVKEVIPFTSKRKRMTVVIEETTHSRSASAKSHKSGLNGTVGRAIFLFISREAKLKKYFSKHLKGN